MIYPIDVNKKISNQRKLVGEDKSKFIISLFLFTNFICFLVLNYINKIFLQFPLVLVVITQILIFTVIGILLFRFLIFDESAKIKEYHNSTADSFSKFLRLRNDTKNIINIHNHSINVFEYINGSATCTLELRFGSNDIQKSMETEKLLNTILKLVYDYNFESRVVITTEKFKGSDEFKNLTDTINSIENTNLQKVIFEITDAILESSLKNSNTEIIYLTIRTRTNYQKTELEALINSIVELSENSFSAFRSIKFLNLDELIDFYRYFYNIAAIDLSLAKSIDIAKEIDDDFQKVVNLVSLRSSNERIFKTSKDNKECFILNERSVNH